MSELHIFDKEYEKESGKIVVGVDEAGRGPLAGPVVASAVIIPTYIEEFSKINDSKKITEKQRDKIYDLIMEHCVVGIGESSVEEIDEINILNATFLAMRRALEDLNKKNKITKDANIILVDGNHKIREYKGDQQEVIKGDAKSLSIAAASIVAKVTRDRIMIEMNNEYPQYMLNKHKGYGTKLHREIIIEQGPSKIHRKSFLKKILQNC